MDWDEEEFFEDRDGNVQGAGSRRQNHHPVPQLDEEAFFEDMDYSETRKIKSRAEWDEEEDLEGIQGHSRGDDGSRMDWENRFHGRRLHNIRRGNARQDTSEASRNATGDECYEGREFPGMGRDHGTEKPWGEDFENADLGGSKDGVQGRYGDEDWGEHSDGTGRNDVEDSQTEHDEGRAPRDGKELNLEEGVDGDSDADEQHTRYQGDESHSNSEDEQFKARDDGRNFEEFDDEEDGGGDPHELDRMLADIEDDELANEEMLKENNPRGMVEFDEEALERLESVKEIKEYQEEPPADRGVDEILRLKTQEKKLDALTRALGTFYQPPKGKPYKAQRMATLKEDLDEKRKKLGHEHPVVIKLLLNLAHELDDYKKYSSSEPLYQELLETRRKMWGEEHEVVATAMIALGNNAIAQERTDEGNKLLGIKEDQLSGVFAGDGLKMLIKCTPSISKTLVNVGDRLLDDKQPEKAASMVKAALLISRMKNPGAHTETADALRHLIQCVLNSNNIQDAEKYAMEELEMRKKLDGPESPDVAVSIATVGYCHIGKQNYREADLEIREGLAMRRKLKGRLDIEVGRMTHYLGITLLGLGLFHEAEDILKDAIGIYERLGYNEHLILPATMMSLSEAYMGQNKIKETHAIRRHAIGLYHKLGVHITDES